MKSGFTLIELLLVIAILSIVTLMSSAFYSRFLNQNSVANTVDQLAGTLRKAQAYTTSGRQNSQWGVNVGSNQITLFAGPSYPSRNSSFDEVFTFPSPVTFSGWNDIIFDRVTGIANTTVAVVISAPGNNSKTLTVNQSGVVTK